jgi:hypothetical protein
VPRDHADRVAQRGQQREDDSRHARGSACRHPLVAGNHRISTLSNGWRR